MNYLTSALSGAIAVIVAAAPLAASSPHRPTWVSIDPLEAPTGDLPRVDQVRLAAGMQVAPRGTGTAASANPFTGYLPSLAQVDFAAWKSAVTTASAARAESPARAAARAAASPGGILQRPYTHVEREPRRTAGINDTVWRAERVGRFGLATDENNRLRISGVLADTAPATRTLRTREDNGAIPLATDTGVRGHGAVRVDSRIGDGPHGSAGSGRGDFDWYAVTAEPGETVVADLTGSVTAVATLVIDRDGRAVAFAANVDHPDLPPPRAEYLSERGGTYHVLIFGASSWQDDWNDSGSGYGAEEEGRYTALIGSWTADRDAFLVHLDTGDVLGATITGGARGLSVQKLDSTYVVRARDFDLGSLYPDASPLPFGGTTSLAYVTEESGWYGVIVESQVGAYTGIVEVYRPGGESDPSPRRQTILLDFDGATVDLSLFGGDLGVRRLSPLRRFLPGWGLSPSQLPALTRTITDTATENLRRDLRAQNLNPDVEVAIVNGSTAPDSFGQPNVSRIIVGGTIKESGIETIGIAENIDPGNYSQEDTGLVLLDLLSAGKGDPVSLNTYLRPDSDAVRFVGQAIGNIVAHEVGHYIGSFHTYNGNSVASLMDSGGAGFWRMFGTGPDRIGGNADDSDTDFVTDRFSLFEPFRGLEDTVNISAWAFSPNKP